MSEHEGFSVPLLEAMLFELPILAHARGAVPDTLGGAGVQFDEKNYEELAEMAYLLANEEDLRERVVEGQLSRLKRFEPRRVESDLRGFIEEVCA
jgi:glycosyltransferase involved in cell wall biosynthesis